MKRFYITTAIDYANGSPHLGHAYEKVLTDVVARFRRLMGDDVTFLTGTDEHGQKVQQSAAREGIEPVDFVERNTARFRELCRALNISNDDFIRTTEERHRKVVHNVLTDLHDRDEIYQDDYTGFYSVKQEQFVTEKEKVDGEWPAVYGEVVEITERNYFFRLGRYQDWLIEHIRENPGFILPRFREKQVLEFLKEPINDLCISRPRERLAWGIPLPFDEDYVTYVWFDALLNYITGAGYGSPDFENWWPADYNVIGKDIMIPAHAIYWPIMLHAIGVPPPKSLLVHGFWAISGRDMSKSAGVTVDPFDLAEHFGADALRYFLIREMNVGQDSNFSEELFLSRYSSDLANDLGNLVNRVLNMTGRYCQGVVPDRSVDDEPERDVRALWETTAGELTGLYEGFQFHLGLEKTIAFVKALNRYAEIRQPWKLAKSEAAEDRARLETSLAVLAEGVRLAAAALAAVMPETTSRIYGLLGLERAVTLWADELTWTDEVAGRSLGERTILFPKH